MERGMTRKRTRCYTQPCFCRSCRMGRIHCTSPM